MKIPDCHARSASNRDLFLCPGCHYSLYRKHGFYIRKGFHAPEGAVAIPVKIQRYRCINPQCHRCTFSILPSMVLRYCRFFWPYLLAINRALTTGATAYRLARHVWHVGRGVIARAAAVLKRLEFWVTGLFRELTDGRPVCGLERMVRLVTGTIGRHELAQRWYRHRYPQRFPYKTG